MDFLLQRIKAIFAGLGAGAGTVILGYIEQLTGPLPHWSEILIIAAIGALSTYFAPANKPVPAA